MKHTATLRRFGTREPNPSEVIALRADHDALAGAGRTLFPTTVVGSLESPRFLVSGHNNPKLGKEVLKGPRTGWPIFHLTLEERATCPRSCEQWATCMGNGMPQARRHAVDDHFLPLLRAEVATVARANPKGVLIRLHALGDFYSVEYVLAWAEMLAMFPQVAVFGYTARRVDDADPASARIARALQVLTDAMWSRFAIRTSSSAPVARSRAIVVESDPGDPDTIVCPAQTGATEACATCGLCWASNARDKTIAFLLHGMTRAKGPRSPKPELAVVESPAAVSAPRSNDEPAKVYAADQMERVLNVLRGCRDAHGWATLSFSALGEASAVPAGSVSFAIDRLVKAGKIEVRKNEPRKPQSYRLLSDVAATVPPRGVAPLAEPRGPWLARKPEPSAKSRHPEPEPVALPSEPKPVSEIAFELPQEEPAGPMTLMNLRVNDCHWPMGDAAPIQRYCGKPVSGTKAYCAKHLAAMYAGKAR